MSPSGRVTILPKGLPQPNSLTSIAAASLHVLPPSAERVTQVPRGLSNFGSYFPWSSYVAVRQKPTTSVPSRA